VDAKALLASDVLVLDTMNEPMLAKFDTQNRTDLVSQITRRGTVLGVGEGLLGDQAYTQKGVVWDSRARAYWQHAGEANQLALMKLALGRAGITGLALPDPQPSLDFGYYYPDGKAGQVFAKWDDFDAWRRAHGKLRPGKPRVAISFFKASYYSGDMALLDALIAEVEKQGSEAIPLFGYPGAVSLQRLLVDSSGKSRAEDEDLGARRRTAQGDGPRIRRRVRVAKRRHRSVHRRRASDSADPRQQVAARHAARRFAYHR
jgi:cobaltochelatase CobN